MWAHTSTQTYIRTSTHTQHTLVLVQSYTRARLDFAESVMWWIRMTRTPLQSLQDEALRVRRSLRPLKPRTSLPQNWVHLRLFAPQSAFPCLARSSAGHQVQVLLLCDEFKVVRAPPLSSVRPFVLDEPAPRCRIQSSVHRTQHEPVNMSLARPVRTCTHAPGKRDMSSCIHVYAVK